MTSPEEDKTKRIEAQLGRILASSAFAGSERHRKLLRFLVEETLKGNADKLNEFVLGFEVFQKGESFDPRIDSIVRVEARRLRERLKKYYEQEGRADPLLMTLRPRSFVPNFEEAGRGETPAGSGFRAWLRSRKTAAIVLASVVGAAALAVLFFRLGPRPPGPPQTVSILVLPFQTLSPAAGQEILGHAMADAIITGLGGAPGLRIVSRGPQPPPGGRPAGAPAEPHADYIVEGIVQVKESRLRVSVKMTDTRAQSYIWADTREAGLEEKGDLERGLVNEIAARVRVPLPPGEGDLVRRRRASSPEAYGAFLKGQYYWYQSDSESLRKSMALFQQAIDRDPQYSPAWAWLSLGCYLQGMRDDGRDGSNLAQGRQAAAKALALDDQLAEAHAAAASYAVLDWNWKAAQQGFRRAVQLNPLWAQGHVMYALLYLAPTRQFRDAIGEMLRARELDPVTRITRVMVAEAFYLGKEYSRAIAEAEDMFRPSPADSPGSRAYFLSLSLSGQGARALKEVSAIVRPGQESSPATSMLGYLLAKHGDRQQAQAIQRRLIDESAKRNVPPLSVAMVSTGLGDYGEAIRQLRQAVDKRTPGVVQISADPVFDPLRSDPRFQALVQAMGLPQAR